VPPPDHPWRRPFLRRRAIPASSNPTQGQSPPAAEGEKASLGELLRGPLQSPSGLLPIYPGEAETENQNLGTFLTS
ncbi:MAG: hypothetical protein LAO31_21685, partial [Acidobacteriia bacterium]|nr:hypothetical protein [Terriglobia bacterium]